MMNKTARTSEQGGARLKFLIVATLLLALGYAGFQFVPVYYQAYQLKDLMQNKIETAVSTGKSPQWIKEQLVKNSEDYGIPATAMIEPQQDSGRMQVRVQFTKPLDFQVFVYNYEFDYTAKSTTFISTK